MGEASISRHLTREFVRLWRGANPQGKVISRDLTRMTIPVIDEAWVSANWTPEESRTEQQNDVLALSTELTRELLEADQYVIGIPTHNWGPSSSFKLWLDQIVRIGETIAIAPSGMKGTLDGKRATFFIAAGWDYGPHSTDAARNHLEAWLRTIFGDLGITNMQFVLADGAAEVRFGRIGLAAFLAPHLDAMQSLFAPSVPG
jgi:FMN-dependent NADH-azoreductase